jgi:hypothetical protein
MSTVTKVVCPSTRVGARQVVLGVWLLAQSGLGAACGNAEKPMDPAAPAATGQVKPAAAGPSSPSEPEVLAPEPEAQEMPRGVSPPQPEARDEADDTQPAWPTSAGAAKAQATNTEGAQAKPAPQKPAPEPAAPKAKPALDSQPAQPKATAPVVSKPAQPKPKPVQPKPPVPVAQPQPPVPAVPVAEPPAPAPAPPPPKKVAVIVPHTDHVRVDVPAGLQHWLDEDDRMKPWLSKAVNVADACYAKVRADNRAAAGVIAFTVTMHENARPSGGVSSVSGPINGIIMCATTRLLGVKMPLFTGDEGASYTVKVRFEP